MAEKPRSFRALRKSHSRGMFVFVSVLLTGASGLTDDRHASISDAARDRDGLLVHSVESPFQSKKTEIKVLMPDMFEKHARYPVVYVLPVEELAGDRFGDGLLEAKKHDLHNRFRAIFVTPTFSHLPWYADHPQDSEIQQESYFLKVVVPFIDEHYPARGDRDGRFLLGFSKSGWGAFSLLLRHPDLFDKAAAWDAPLMQSRPDRFGMGEIFGTQENFEDYQISRLLEQRGAGLQRPRGLILLGSCNFGDHHEKAHALMTDLKIPHVYRGTQHQEHIWEGGWVPEAVGLLLGDE
jgi:hypothetical protein